MNSKLNYHDLIPSRSLSLARRVGDFFRRLTCKLFGHRINENPDYHWCERCGLAYSEIYFKWDENGDPVHWKSSSEGKAS